MIGKNISHYKILEKLGGGGMGVVYKAEDTKLKRTVAIKFLPPDLIRDDEAKVRFIQEAQAASALEHTNICTIHEVDETEDGQLFIVMTCYEGDTLKKKIEKGPLEIEDAVRIVLQIAQGLSKAHEKGIVHRDIKPANIMITDDCVVKILDFGLAKLAGQTRITKTATTMGTVAYMSPEQSRGEIVDQRTDIWSLGVILYQMITAQLPFNGEYEQAVIYSILNDDPESIDNLRTDVPTEIQKLVQKSLQKDVEKRYQNIGEIISVLEELKRKLDSGQLATPDQKKEHRRKRKKYLYTALAVLIVSVIAVALLLWRNSRVRQLNAFLDQLQPLVEASRFDDAFELLNDSDLALKNLKNRDLVVRMGGELSVETIPVGSLVTLARIKSKPELSKGEDFLIGSTPIRDHLIIAGEYLIKLSFEGMNSLEFLVQIEPGEPLEFRRTLLEQKEEFLGMVRIDEGMSLEGQSIPAFLIDKHEVTNTEFFAFVSAGGYIEKQFWPDELVIDSSPLPWESAVKSFIDKTGIRCPRFWSGGKYPEGKADHPVTGISWYEALAYAQWAGKDLPTWDQWWLAAKGGTERLYPWGDDTYTPHLRANFGYMGTDPVESYPLGVSLFGCYDMAGNVREWLKDSKSQKGLCTVVGGSWKDPLYMIEPSHAESFEPDFADDYIGFRCVKAIVKNK
jgi:serine/threonine protein kinase/formylglycine-generating enzyme required for sulfatase activity